MQKKRILVVDDEKGFTAMLSLNLESTGHYDVRVVNDPTLVLSIAAQYHPDLILLDVIMPKLEGPDVAASIREIENFQGIPIIFLTATVTKDEVESQNGRIGGQCFVAKPSNLSTLLHSIEDNLSFIAGNN